MSFLSLCSFVVADLRRTTATAYVVIAAFCATDLHSRFARGASWSIRLNQKEKLG
jgi:hypothetical protein